MGINDLAPNKTVCGICGTNCGIIIYHEKGKISIEGDPEHPISKGYICPKIKKLAQNLFAEERLRQPLKKKRDGNWQEISWDEAIDFIADKLSSIKQLYGPESLAIHIGQAGENKQFTDYAERFCNLFQTPNFSTTDSLCHTARIMANVLTCGYNPVPDVANSDCIVLWGYNPARSFPPLMQYINKARKRGAKLIVIDPMKTKLSDQADIYLQIRPGTDAALALGLLNVIVEQDLYDHDFVSKWTTGFEQLSDRLKYYLPEKVAAITGVPANDIIKAARTYAAADSACIAQGNALELHDTGFQALRAISSLQAITGNLDIRGGALLVKSPELSSMQINNPGHTVPAVGKKEFPLFYHFTNHAQANIYSKAILYGDPYPVKAFIVAGSNPLLTWPNAGELKEALGKLDLLVVVDHYITETAEQADIVLPASTFLSSYELWNSVSLTGEYRLGLAPRVVEDSNLNDWHFWRILARKMGYDQYFPWDNEVEALNERLQPMDLDLETLSLYPYGYIYDQITYKKYEREGFMTESGKVEFYSSCLDQYKYDPLPGFWTSNGDPPSDSDFPLILSSGARSIEEKSSGSDISAVVPTLEVLQDTASKLGINENDIVRLISSRGEIKIKVKYTDNVLPDVVLIRQGWNEANANILTDNEQLDPITGFPAARNVKVRIERL